MQLVLVTVYDFEMCNNVYNPHKYEVQSCIHIV